MSYSLDVVGDRWTLLIVRNLMFGALRYSDLKQGLPNIASNLLAKRLKEMEANGLISQRRLLPPAKADVYELTERGIALRGVIGALTEWGVPYLKPLPPEEDYAGIIPFRGYLSKFFATDRAQGVSLVCQLMVEDYPLMIMIDDGSLRTRMGIHDNPDITLIVNDLRMLVGVLNDVVPIDDALANAQIILESLDERKQLEQLIKLFNNIEQ